MVKKTKTTTENKTNLTNQKKIMNDEKKVVDEVIIKNKLKDLFKMTA